MVSLTSDPRVREDPYVVYAQLREREPVLRTAAGVVLSRYQDVRDALGDPRLGAVFTLAEETPFVRSRGGLDAPAVRQQGMGMLFKDPPEHTRLRRLVGKAFSRRSLDSLRPAVESLVDDLLDRAAARGAMDAIADFALPIPVSVICTLVGIPPQEAMRFRHLVDITTAFLDVHLTPASVARMNEAQLALTEALEEVVERRRDDPGDDLISALLAVEDDGERLTREEVVAMVDLLFGAGHETTVNLIGNGLYALLRHPAQLAALREEPGLVAQAVEETLRFDSPVQTAARRVLTEVEFDGVTVAPGQMVTMLIGAAHRDSRRFADPDRFDIRRPDIDVLSFGGGVHYCVGSMLARMEASIALGRLFERFAAVTLATDALTWRPHGTLRGLEALPLELA